MREILVSVVTYVQYVYLVILFATQEFTGTTVTKSEQADWLNFLVTPFQSTPMFLSILEWYQCQWCPWQQANIVFLKKNVKYG